MNILLNKRKYQFTSSNLPCLIHGQENSGASLFTIAVASQLFKQGKKLVFLSAYPKAREEFIKQTGVKNSITLHNKNEMGNLEKYDVIFLLKDSAKLLEELTGELNDLSKRIVLIKNIELFDETINFSLSDMQQLIVSGDIEQCTYKTKLLINKYKSSIYFSPLAGITLPPLQHYSGYLKSTEFEGVVNLE